MMVHPLSFLRAAYEVAYHVVNLQQVLGSRAGLSLPIEWYATPPFVEMKFAYNKLYMPLINLLLSNINTYRI